MSANPAPKKSLGQHFLHDPAIIQRIVDAIAPRKGDCLIEIGPGPGALTLPLLRAAGTLHAVEMDQRMIAHLESASPDNLTLHHADALKFDYCAVSNNRPLRLAGNLPYQISSPLLFRLLALKCTVVDMHFMLQKEVVARMTALPGSKDYGRLSVMLAVRCTAKQLFIVKPGAFNPPPKVDSAVVRLMPHTPDWAPENPKRFAAIVSAAFSARRKTLRNALTRSPTLGLSVQDLEDAGIDPGLRPEKIAPKEYARLADQGGRA